ncbi:hypothetical protein GQ42DRAFT_161986 [Ramicandelaber brevisporus]|nr:hypothetical protein GQ42DRAFT_161986 [Ramicandelaber brevisporus]
MDLAQLLNRPVKRVRWSDVQPEPVVSTVPSLNPDVISIVFKFIFTADRFKLRLVSRAWYIAYDSYYRYSTLRCVLGNLVGKRRRLLDILREHGRRLRILIVPEPLIRYYIALEPGFPSLVPNITRIYVEWLGQHVDVMAKFIASLKQLRYLQIHSHRPEHITPEDWEAFDEAFALGSASDSAIDLGAYSDQAGAGSQQQQQQQQQQQLVKYDRGTGRKLKWLHLYDVCPSPGNPIIGKNMMALLPQLGSLAVVAKEMTPQYLRDLLSNCRQLQQLTVDLIFHSDVLCEVVNMVCGCPVHDDNSINSKDDGNSNDNSNDSSSSNNDNNAYTNAKTDGNKSFLPNLNELTIMINNSIYITERDQPDSLIGPLYRLRDFDKPQFRLGFYITADACILANPDAIAFERRILHSFFSSCKPRIWIMQFYDEKSSLPSYCPLYEVAVACPVSWHIHLEQLVISALPPLQLKDALIMALNDEKRFPRLRSVYIVILRDEDYDPIKDFAEKLNSRLIVRTEDKSQIGEQEESVNVNQLLVDSENSDDDDDELDDDDDELDDELDNRGKLTDD